ncbi:putative RfeD protein [Golovinomyces cichoracearum]|uniref:Putative RfeD protein n=1 Tax=Golovinomyces cichoracearum TaxID=62708 RepID=A0A420IJY7_9PEZI|nr:putative RfeD protein [Golovinomyces cichoracearum]
MVGCHTRTMSPRSTFASSISISDTSNEVMCPLRNQDGSGCRKRCLGEKRYRSMQEHIRRAHPENYIPKLPATEESFRLMISTLSSDRVQLQSKSNLSPHSLFTPFNSNDSLDDKFVDHGGDRKSYYGEDSSTPNTPVNKNLQAFEERQSITSIPAAYAAAALAQMHNNRLEPESEIEGEWSSDTEAHKTSTRYLIEFSASKIKSNGTKSDPFSPLSRRSELLPSIISTPQLQRSSTLPPIQRIPSLNRPRKESISKRAREPQHKRNRSRGENTNLWRVSFDRKAQSAEPSSGLSVEWGKRWEDLIDAATSATKDSEENTLPKSPSTREPQPMDLEELRVPSLSSVSGISTSQTYHQKYQASPLQQTSTPPSNLANGSEAIPPIKRESGEDRNPDSSVNFPSQPIQIYCASCHGLSSLNQSYVCTECICGICEACVDSLIIDDGARRKCPNCATIGGRYKKINLKTK